MRFISVQNEFFVRLSSDWFPMSNIAWNNCLNIIESLKFRLQKIENLIYILYTGQFLSSNEKVLFKDRDEKQFFVRIRVGFLSIAFRVSIFKRNSYYLHRSSFWILRLWKQYSKSPRAFKRNIQSQYSKGTPM